jgi:hypothetical protein
MNRTRRWLLGLTVGLLLVGAVALDPSRELWGRLCGENFYQDRATSYWRRELAAWAADKNPLLKTTPPSWLERVKSWLPVSRAVKQPFVLDGDAAALPVLSDLLADTARRPCRCCAGR